MNSIEDLHKRVSVAKVTEPRPTEEQLYAMIKAATRAADHGNMHPWRFLVIEGTGLIKLGDLFAKCAASKKADITEPELERFKSMPLRAPMIIVVIAKYRENAKVPKIEQLLSAGAAAQNLLNAAFFLGLGAIWKTGDMAYDREVMTGLGMVDNEEIVGFIYLGTPVKNPHEPPTLNTTDFFSRWPNL